MDKNIQEQIGRIAFLHETVQEIKDINDIDDKDIEVKNGMISIGDKKSGYMHPVIIINREGGVPIIQIVNLEDVMAIQIMRVMNLNLISTYTYDNAVVRSEGNVAIDDVAVASIFDNEVWIFIVNKNVVKKFKYEKNDWQYVDSISGASDKKLF